MPDFQFSCPIPLDQYPHVLMAHGSGGKLMQQLIQQMFIPAFTPEGKQTTLQHDSALLPVPSDRIAFTTDSYVIQPLFFPGGDIGSLAIYGTVNDLAMSGAKPSYISVGFILEEGLPMKTLWNIIQSMRRAAASVGIRIVTGDTKVVEKGKGDGIFINTAGVGIVEHRYRIAPQSIRSGDVILLNGDVGRHGIAIMAMREGLEFESTIKSDSASVAHVVLDLIKAGVDTHCLRDLTRGGLASALNEIAQASGMAIQVDEGLIPVREDVQGACEILGFDPLYVANEGRFVAFVPQSKVEKALAIMRSHNQQACGIGSVIGRSNQPMGLVTLQSRIGASRILDLLSGEQLPRIC